MKEYTVCAYSRENIFSGTIGPFRSRAEAERAATTMAAKPDIKSVTIKTEEVDEEEEA